MRTHIPLYTLEQVEIMGLPAVYTKKYDTRHLGYDGEKFGNIYQHAITYPDRGGVHEEFSFDLNPLPDLPEEGWRHVFGCSCKACIGEYR